VRSLLAAVPLAVAVLLTPVSAGIGTHEPFGMGPRAVLAASPSPSEAAGDTRSPGEGPGLVGQPLQALLGVLVVAVASALLTLAYVRATNRDRSERRP
jgi:hypothetical protein